MFQRQRQRVIQRLQQRIVPLDMKFTDSKFCQDKTVCSVCRNNEDFRRLISNGYDWDGVCRLDVIAPTVVWLTSKSIHRFFFNLFQLACAKQSIQIKLLGKNRRNYKANISLFYNVVTWGMKVPQRWYDKRQKNVLYLENGLFSQSHGCYIDTSGWFTDSSIVTGQEYFEIAEGWEEAEYQSIAQSLYGDVPFMKSYNEDGPILLILQSRRDASVLYHFDGNGKGENTILSLLRIVNRYFSNREVLVRPHPRFHSEWKKVSTQALRYFGENWREDNSRNVYQTIKRCSKVITINSTVATEALYTGIPVATLGKSTFTGSDVTLECAGNFDRLLEFDSFVPNASKIKRYLAAIMRHQLKYGSSLEDVERNRSFQKWISQHIVINNDKEALSRLVQIAVDRNTELLAVSDDERQRRLGICLSCSDFNSNYYSI